MRQSLLSNEETQFLLDEKEILANLLLQLAEVGVAKEDLSTLQKAIMQLDELFLIVLVGEFNAGKSALINALLGEKVLPEGVTPTTSRVTLVKWGEQAAEHPVDDNYAIYTYPMPMLKELNIVDSPGTNAIIRHHERLTNEFIPRSDFVLFITSADRPMTESERQFLDRILSWGKKIVFVLNKSDIFEDEAALREVEGFIRTHATTVLGNEPELFTVSARLAQRAWHEPDAERQLQYRKASNLDALEKYITASLDDTTRLKLKFQSPLGVADRMTAKAAESIHAQAQDLSEDRETVKALDSSIAGYERELHDELAPRLAEVENILHRLEMRGLDFFDSTMRLTNIHNLIRGDKVRAQFEKEVLQDLPQQVDDQVQRLIDWLVDKDLHEWQRVMTFLQSRQAMNIEHIVGASTVPQSNRRRELIDSVGRRAQTIVDGYDRIKEASQLGANVEAAVAQTALFEAGAVGLGALVTTAVLSSALDVTGIIAAGTLAVVGILVIPYKRKKAKENFKAKMADLRTNLIDALTTSFTHETSNAVSRIKDNVAPYTRYVLSEQERIDKAERMVDEIRQRISALRSKIESVVK